MWNINSQCNIVAIFKIKKNNDGHGCTSYKIWFGIFKRKLEKILRNRENLNVEKISVAIKEFVENYDKYTIEKKEFSRQSQIQSSFTLKLRSKVMKTRYE